MPLKARLSMIRQYLVLRVRFWFRLPVDDVRDAQIEQQINGFNQFMDKAQAAIKTLVTINTNLNERLSLYEREIPRMRTLKQHWDLEQAGLQKAAAKPNGALENGILRELDANPAARNTVELNKWSPAEAHPA